MKLSTQKLARTAVLLAAVAIAVLLPAEAGAAATTLIRSARSGPWSAASTWEGRHVPAAGDRVQIRAGHRVTYDVSSDRAIRSIHIAGTLAFAPDRDTRLDVGLIKIQPGEDASENGFDCAAHIHAVDAHRPRPALEVGTPWQPVEAAHTALIRLVYFRGMDRDSCPAIVCCGGRMDFHGAPMNHTWVKLGATAQLGDTTLTLAESVTGWRVGDHLIITATQREPTGSTNGSFRPDLSAAQAGRAARVARLSPASRAALEAREADLLAAYSIKFAVGPARGKGAESDQSPLDPAARAVAGARTALWAAENAASHHSPGKEAAVAGIMAARSTLAIVGQRVPPPAEAALETARSALRNAEADLARDAPNREAVQSAITAARAAIAAADAAGVTAPPEQVAALKNQMLELAASQHDWHPLTAYTEERVIRAISGTTITMDRPLGHHHLGAGDYRGEVADLSRNVIVESADPAGVRGHTMYHHGSAGSISYAEFRHLGKEGVLGRYSLHFHLVGDTMRGSSVIGASIWDSANRWLTVHGTNYLVVRDCVGYQSVGHGFYVEDGTEEYNVFDHNLAVQAYRAEPLPKQNLPFDTNEGAGFWWANSRNTFTRNVACECDGYGYRFEATPMEGFDLRLPVQQPDGTISRADIRTLPFVRFEDNEAHSVLWGVNMGEGIDSVGPDTRHPFVLRNTRIWNAQWAFQPNAPSLIVDGMDIYASRYGIFQPIYDHHAYNGLAISRTEVPGGHPFLLIGQKPEGLEFHDEVPDDRVSTRSNEGASAADRTAEKRLAVEAYLSSEKGKEEKPSGPGQPPGGAALSPAAIQDLKRRFAENAGDPLFEPPAGARPKVPSATLSSAAFPKPLDPVDDLPPATVITFVGSPANGKLIVRGTTSDNGSVKRVLVNGREARPLATNFAEWEITLYAPTTGKVEIRASAEDMAGNIERTPHVITAAVPR
jgi:hypothetical protein